MVLALLSFALAGELLVQHARVWDGTEAAPFGPVDLLVRDDVIIAIGQDLAAVDGATRLDAAGATLIPGLIDSHVHLSMDPGAGWREDSAAAREILLRAHLSAYLACGVTTVVDPGVLPAESRRIQDILAAGVPGPRYLHTGPVFSPPGGYVAAVIPGFPSVATAEEVEAQLDGLVRDGGIAAKTTVERGFFVPRYPLYDDAVFVAIRAGAAARGLPVWAHAVSPAEQRLALDRLAPRVMVHAVERPDRALIRRLVAEGVTSVSTLAAADAFSVALDLAGLDDPLLDRVVPAAELATARDPAVARGFLQRVATDMLPGAPRWFGSPALLRPVLNAHARHAEAAIRALRDAGAGLVMGSDAGNWPMIPYLFHGPSSLHELDLLVAAGLSPREALTSATRSAATMLALPRLGTLGPGQVADFVIVDGDPLTDLRALRRIRWTVRGGVAGTPEAWLATPE